MNVLAVDDEMSILDLYKVLLASYGIKIIGFDNGREALDHLDHNYVDAIILDLHMPDIDGYQFLDILKDKKKFDGPVIFITGQVEPKLKELEKEKVIEKVYCKPIIETTLAMHLKSLMIKTKRKTSVLYIDDDRVSHALAKKVFGDLGWTMTSVQDPGEGLDLLLKDHKSYGLVIVDHLMPDLDGDQLIRQVKEKISDFDLTCILVSGSSPSGLVCDLFDVILKKPVSKEKILHEVVQTHLSKMNDLNNSG